MEERLLFILQKAAMLVHQITYKQGRKMFKKTIEGILSRVRHAPTWAAIVVGVLAFGTIGFASSGEFRKVVIYTFAPKAWMDVYYTSDVAICEAHFSGQLTIGGEVETRIPYRGRLAQGTHRVTIEREDGAVYDEEIEVTSLGHTIEISCLESGEWSILSFISNREHYGDPVSLPLSSPISSPVAPPASSPVTEGALVESTESQPASEEDEQVASGDGRNEDTEEVPKQETPEPVPEQQEQQAVTPDQPQPDSVPATKPAPIAEECQAPIMRAAKLINRQAPAGLLNMLDITVDCLDGAELHTINVEWRHRETGKMGSYSADLGMTINQNKHSFGLDIQTREDDPQGPWDIVKLSLMGRHQEIVYHKDAIDEAFWLTEPNTPGTGNYPDDKTAPTMSNLKLSKTTITAGDSITFSADFADESSGVWTTNIIIRSPSEGQIISDGFTLTGNSGKVTITIPPSAETGNWFIHVIDVHDNAGNMRSYPASELNRTVEVKAHPSIAADTTPPELLLFQLSKSSVMANESFTVKVKVKEEGVGLDHVGVNFVHTSVPGNFSVVLNAFNNQGEATVAVGSLDGYPTGVYEVHSLFLLDKAGNEEWHYQDDLNKTITITP